MSNFWDLILLIASTFIFIAYLWSCSRSSSICSGIPTGGGSKVLWIIGLIFVPVLTSLVYILTRGRGMAEAALRGAAGAVGRRGYIREVAGNRRRTDRRRERLLDAGTINADEFARLKAKALG